MSEKLLLEPTATAQWKQLIQDAEQKTLCTLDEDMESYLIFTLMRFSQSPTLASKALATDYLTVSQLSGHARQQQLRDLGDECLLLSGLFPQLAEKRLVRVSYYVDLGRSAYNHLSQILNQAFSELYQHLATNFLQLMDVLHNIRSEPVLQPLLAHELWSDTASENAYRILTANSKATPVKPHSKHRH